MSIILKEKPKPVTSVPRRATENEPSQSRRLLIALGLLLAALIVVVVKDRQFWFGSRATPEQASNEPATPPVAALTTPDASAPVAQAPALPTTAARKKPKSKLPTNRPPSSNTETPVTESSPAGPMITATNRTVLPPLEVEVVAGNQHRPLPTSNNSLKVEMQGSPARSPATTPPAQVPDNTPVANTTTEVTIPPATAQRVASSVEPSYPTLARQMKVQGAVVLQALIDKAGNIEELHVISGPSILASAAQQALRQWHFKPYLQAGQPVETEARVTVNFTISTY